MCIMKCFDLPVQRAAPSKLFLLEKIRHGWIYKEELDRDETKFGLFYVNVFLSVTKVTENVVLPTRP